MNNNIFKETFTEAVNSLPKSERNLLFEMFDLEYPISDLFPKTKSGDILYTLEQVEYKFQGKDSDFALGPMTLKIPKGKFTAILGESGSGKTTLLSLIGLLRKQTAGKLTMHINNKAFDTEKLWENEKAIEQLRANHIGFALQKGELLPYLSLYENAQLVPRFLKKDRKSIKESLNDVFELLYKERGKKLKRIKKSKKNKVSYGQHQRGGIARALANNPPVILADEPTGNLDQLTGRKTMQIFREIIDQGAEQRKYKSIIVVTHDLQLALEFADEIIVLNRGKKQSHCVCQNIEHKIWYATEHKPREIKYRYYRPIDLEKRLLEDMKTK
jgi:putative ABC transport system ATP-binding protein